MQSIDLHLINTAAGEARRAAILRPEQARWSEAWRRLACRLGRVIPGMAAAVAAYSLLQLAGQSFLPLAALAGTASLVYLGTATLSANPLSALLDLTAAALTAFLAYTAADAAALAIAFLVHALWGILRTAVDSDPPHHLTGNWSAFATVISIFVLIG